MRILIRAAIVLLGVALAAQAGGCVRSNEPSISSKDADPLRGDSVGYYEVPHEGVIYVVGSIQARDRVRNDQLPPTTSGGFSSQGQTVLFETNNTGLAERLMAEYDRRHGLSSR
ncbi:MAG TPA: hypothetical protein VGP94_06340 [Tepidisphaeraceae bacterium]|jgi:hypothetical protein|nr:hypothetical protein [Tepidisphaeraceae bacterium]